MIIFLLAGEILNLISIDSQKIEDACVMFNMMWSCPLQVGLAIFFLYQTIGVSVFVGTLKNAGAWYFFVVITHLLC
jgi:hypothetical protein